MSIEKALEYAINIISSYEMDIRDWDKGRLIKDGFCQGRIYKKALERIEEIKNKQGKIK